MKKRTFYTEAAFVLGLALLALGTALTEFGDLGISMVVAPAYILHLKLSQFLPFFSFGMAEYVLQAFVLMLMMLLLRRVRWVWLLSFGTAVLYGLLLDGGLLLTACLPAENPAVRWIVYTVGVLLCGAGLALLFHSYLPPEAYELFVRELAGKWRWKLHTVKTVYDCCSCAIAAGLSLLLLGDLQGIGVGTVLCALLNGTMIRSFGRLFDRFWHFSDRFPMRKYFIESEETL